MWGNSVKITVSDDGFVLKSRKRSRTILWSDISEVLVSNRDNFVYTVSYLLFNYDDQCISIPEETPEFRKLESRLLEIFPGLAPNWQGILNETPIEGSRTVWSRPQID